jgi:hypothetical protein
MIMASDGGALARGGGLRLTSHKLRWLRIFLIISESSINEIIFIDPGHLGHNKGSTLYVAAVFVWVFKTFSFFWHRTQLQSLGSNLTAGISANNVAAEKRHAS